jgi:hypothetical protein
MIRFVTGTDVLVVSDGIDFGVGAPILLFNIDESKSYISMEVMSKKIKLKNLTTDARLIVAFRFIIDRTESNPAKEADELEDNSYFSLNILIKYH